MRVHRFGIWVLLVVSICTVGMLVGLSDDADATYYNVYDERDIYIYYESLDGRTIYQGDKDINFYIRVMNGNYDSMTDDHPIRHVAVAIETQVHDGDGKVVDTPVSRWTTRTVNNDATIYDGSYAWFYDFEFNVKPGAKSLRYNFTVRVGYQTTDGKDLAYKGYIHWTLSPSIIPYDFPTFYPGMQDRSSSVRFDVRRYMSEMELTLESPKADFTFFGDQVTVMAEREQYTSGDWYPVFLISVDRWSQPGEYEGPFTIHYKNGAGVRCTETGEVTFHVNDLAMVEVRASTSAITQGTTETTLPLTVRNTGTARLYDVELAIASVSSDYFWLAPDHFEGDTPVSYRWIKVGDLDTWAEVTVNVNMSIDQMIPQGLHKLMFDFRAVYRDTRTDDVLTTSGSWTSSSEGMVPRVVMRTGTITLSPITYDVDGMYLRMKVVDLDMDVTMSSVLTPTVGTKRENLEISFILENIGDVEYRDVTAKLETGTHVSPFVNPLQEGEGYSEVITVPGIMDPGDQVRVSIYVDLSATADPGTYDVPVVVNGDDARSGQALTADLTLRVLVTGDGPKLKIRAVSPSTISGGKDFTLTLTIDNIGDDTARKVVLGSMYGADGVMMDEGIFRPFEPLALPLYLDDIEPGNTTMAEIDMRCNPGLEDSRVYSMTFFLDYVDSRGNHPTPVQAVQEVSVKMEGGDGPGLEFRTVSPDTIESGKDFTLNLAVFNTGDETAHNVVLGMGPREGPADGPALPSSECPPEPTTLPLYLGDIEPDHFAMVEIPMRCNKDMLEGHVYTMCFNLDYTDPAGNHPQNTEMVHQVSIKTEGSGVTMETTMYSTGNTLLIVLTICLLAIVVIYAVATLARINQGRKPKKAKEAKEAKEWPKTPRPPTEVETSQVYADYGSNSHEPPAEQSQPQEQASGYDQAATDDQTQDQQYPQEQASIEADTSSYYEKQLWGGDQAGGTEETDAQEPPPQ